MYPDCKTVYTQTSSTWVKHNKLDFTSCLFPLKTSCLAYVTETLRKLVNIPYAK